MNFSWQSGGSERGIGDNRVWHVSHPLGVATVAAVAAVAAVATTVGTQSRMPGIRTLSFGGVSTFSTSIKTLLILYCSAISTVIRS